MNQEEFNELARAMMTNVKTQADIVRVQTTTSAQQQPTRGLEVKAREIAILFQHTKFEEFVEGVNTVLKSIADKYGFKYEPIQYQSYLKP